MSVAILPKLRMIGHLMQPGARMSPGNSFAQRVEWRLIEQSVAKGWILILLNVVLAVLFAVVYLSSGRDLSLVLLVLLPRLGASACAIGVLIWLARAGETWRRTHQRAARRLLIFQEAAILSVFGATATVWMSVQDYSVNALSMAGIGAFGAISAALAPRDRLAAVIGRVGLFTPLILFCLIKAPVYWGLLLALCLFALTLSLIIAFAVYRENLRQATLEEDLAEARLSAERALAREQSARTALEDETALRERFLHAVTHDLRQPLNALNFHLRRLRKTPTPEVAGAFVTTAESCLNSAEAIIESVAGSAWMRGDLPPADLRPAPLGPLLTAITAEAHPLAEHHGLRLTLAPTTASVIADRDYLERVVRNLVRNALQHAGTRILIGVRRRGDAVVIIVTDDGPGVPAAAQEAIFEPFYQIKSAGKRSDGNVGLGLSIVSELTRAMGGEVALRSIEGRGASFQVSLPSAATRLTAAVSIALVLVIDDDPIAATMTVEALEAAGCVAAQYEGDLTADSVAAAVKAAQGPVLLDYHLGPDFTAPDILTRLDRAALRKITIITSDASIAVKEGLSRFHVDRLLKPVTSETLSALFASK